jgi:demethylmenaquinone methyltransferase/2-methoxy-6-polyprenyl-1,4-benzoquinol methylase
MLSPGSSFYSDGPLRARRVEDLFGVIASQYDLINDLQSLGLHRLWKRQLLRMAAPKSTDMALDLCCGTGDIAFGIRVSGATTIGVDFSGPMLEIAEKRRTRLSLPFLRGDALATPFPDATFDLITMGYGLRNLANLEEGLEEMNRLLKPGGRMLILDFGKPNNRVWRGCYFSYLRWCVPLFGRLLCGNSATHAYILESLLKYPGQFGVAEKMKTMGLKGIAVTDLLGGVMSINYGSKALTS